jgi:tetratricopeptide (TPR) repeat protein
MSVAGAPRGLSYLLHKLWAMGWMLVGRQLKAQTVLGQMLKHWPGDAYALSSRAHLRAQAGQSDAAIADAQLLVQLHPARSAADWFNLAFLLERANQLADAEAAFRRALALDEQLDRAWYGLGVTLVRLGRHDDAVAALKRNTELQPMSPYGWYQLAQVHVARQQPEEAKRVIRHLRKFEPNVAAQIERETGLLAKND